MRFTCFIYFATFFRWSAHTECFFPRFNSSKMAHQGYMSTSITLPFYIWQVATVLQSIIVMFVMDRVTTSRLIYFKKKMLVWFSLKEHHLVWVIDQDYFQYKMIEEAEKEASSNNRTHIDFVFKIRSICSQDNTRTQSPPTGICCHASVVCSGSFMYHAIMQLWNWTLTA